jgi:DNA-binding NarL/FixJ family response regulator
VVQSALAVPYYRDDSCFDDGTGGDPGPHLASRRPDVGEDATWSDDGVVRPRECWDVERHATDPDYAADLGTRRFWQGSIGTHGLHILLIADSDNAMTTLPLTEINAEQRMVVLPPTEGNVGEQYGRGFEKPLVAVATPYAGGPPAQQPDPEPAPSELTWAGDDRLRGRSVELAARLTDDDGAPVIGREVIFEADGRTWSAVTGDDGVARAMAEIAPARQELAVTARFAGDARHGPSTLSVVLRRGVHVLDLRRAGEWTDALTAWCDRGDVVPFRGECLVHRSQVLQARGDWEPALEQATTAQELLDRAGHPALGSACYQRAELHRVRGELDRAEEAYRTASAHGREPVPGLALLRLAEAQLDGAAAMVRRMHTEAVGALGRLAVLPAVVEVMVATDDLDTARAAAHELTVLAASGGSAVVGALSAHATGSVLLATGDPASAAAALRRAVETWRILVMPYDGARSQELIGLACRALGDHESAELELAAAEATYARLGASVDADRARRHRRRGGVGDAGRDPGSSHLTQRERDVLRHVAAGRTNREIGAELGISEHTAARHVQNIFTKLGLSSRAAATAHAYEHGSCRRIPARAAGGAWSGRTTRPADGDGASRRCGRGRAGRTVDLTRR